MKVLSLTRWAPAAAIGGSMEDAGRLLSPAPKEAAVSAGGARTIDIDLGAPTAVDQIMLGHTNAADGFSLAASYGLAGYAETALPAIVAAPANAITLPRHMLADYDAPITARYIRLSGALPAGFYAGTLTVGRALRPTWGHEWGGGRFVLDTGSNQRLLGGGFGVAPGARVGGWEWTMGDLTDLEVDQLYRLQRDAGTTSPVLVVEDPDATAPGLNERIHYGLFAKLDVYNRKAQGQTSWGLRIEEWG